MNAFVCKPHGGIRITRSSCALRHTSAAKVYGPSSARTGKVWSEQCATCPLGQAHARGEAPMRWADESVVELAVLIPAGALLRSEPARRRARRATIAVG